MRHQFDVWPGEAAGAGAAAVAATRGAACRLGWVAAGRCAGCACRGAVGAAWARCVGLTSCALAKVGADKAAAKTAIAIERGRKDILIT
ncbi:hypothetical protein GCM10008174_01210 [Methylopila turkensis]|uniref:Uncharacterized protein n=1 Tax=Methylopila turkensis TaxID=1437816 RepID=A0A9W6JM64_9HYPH|nr:hypothetical protein GCM10008174_01210 [Methylopila turkensis]